MVNGNDGPEFLDGGECRRLLQTARTGRVGFTANALPAVQPVHYAVHDRRIVFTAAPSGRLAGACRGSVIVVQADGVDRATGNAAWTVEVVGVARVVTDPGEAAEFDRLGLVPDTPGATRCYITVAMELVRGWRAVVDAPLLHPAAIDEHRATA